MPDALLPLFGQTDIPPGVPFAFLYERFSNPDQEGGNSIDRQRRDLEAIARDILKLPLSTTLTYPGLSGWTGENLASGALGSLTKLVSRGVIPAGSVMILDEWSRLTRQGLSRAVPMMFDLINNGLGIYVKNESRLYDRKVVDARDGVMHVMSAVFQMGVNNTDSSGKSYKVLDAKRTVRDKAVNEGKRFLGYLPSWIVKSVVGNVVVYTVDPIKAKVITRIFREAEYQGTTQIAAGLQRDWLAGDLDCAPFGADRVKYEKNANGTRKRNADDSFVTRPFGHGWHAATARDILRDDAVRGIYRPTQKNHGNGNKRAPTGQVRHDFFPVVIDAEQWQRTHDAIARRRARHGNGGGQKGGEMTNLLSGMCQCAFCGGPMVTQTARGYAYLRCRGRVVLHNCDNPYGGNVKEVERVVLGVIHDLRLLFDNGTLSQGDDRGAATRQEIARLRARVEVINEQTDAYAELPKALRQARQSMIDALAKELEDIEARLPGLERQLADEQGGGVQDHLTAVDRLVELALSPKGTTGRGPARQRINAELFSVVDGIQFSPDGISIYLGAAQYVALINEHSLITYYEYDDEGRRREFLLNGRRMPWEAIDADAWAIVQQMRRQHAAIYETTRRRAAHNSTSRMT